jgi:DNA-binding GntR family transcriptional regulator
MTAEQFTNQLGISRSAVRQALNRLEAKGLVCIELRRGAFVRESSMKEVRNKVGDLYEFSRDI